MKGKALEYFKPGEKMTMMYCSVMTHANAKKEISSECSYQESNLRPSDFLFGRSTTELQENRGS